MFSATTAQKARLFDLVTGVQEMVRDGNRDPEEVARVLQVVKDDPDFAVHLLNRSVPTFKVWQILTIGGKSKDELLVKIEAAGQFASDRAKDVMSKPTFTTLPEPTTLNLARVKVRDLGFTKNPTTTRLFARIREVGELCPAEIGPHIRLALKDQPKGDIFWVAMETITDSDGLPGVFCVKRSDSGEAWLSCNYVGPDHQWYLENEIVFVLRNSLYSPVPSGSFLFRCLLSILPTSSLPR